MKLAIKPDPWRPLGALTAARIALGRAGAALPTRAVLDFDIAHALARDAVHQPLDVGDLMMRCRQQLALDVIVVHSQAGDRSIYLQRPDLGRRLDEAGVVALARQPVARLGPRLDAERESPLAITLVQALASADKMDWAEGVRKR